MIKLFKRIEKKFIVKKDQFNLLFPKLMELMEYDNYCSQNKFYTIHNIYFDDSYNSIIRHSITKPYFKEKLRVRSYNEIISEDDKFFVEIKKKMNGTVYKRREVISLKDWSNFTCDDNQILKEVNHLIHYFKLVPKVYISYDRIALVGKNDSQFRITFDYNIRSRREHLNLNSNSLDKYVVAKDMYIMEIKINQSMELWLSKLLSELNIYSSSFSKYAVEYTNFIREEKNNGMGSKYEY